jgi:hypothetical protein
MSGASILRAVGLLLPLTAFAAQTPTFTSLSVLPANATRPAPLRRFMLVSIYGRHLGPDSGCTAERAFSEPVELCSTSVSIGGRKAALLYVQDKQINIRVPGTAPTEGMVDFVVTYSGHASAPVPIRFATLTASVKLSGPAYVHMPIWIDVDLPDPHWRSLRYPIAISPADFGGHQFEVRGNGVVLPQIKPTQVLPHGGSRLSSDGMIGGGSLVGLPHEPKNRSRLPLHLIYGFDQAGLYDVRYTGRDVDGQVLVRSEWFQFEVQDFPPAKRAAWLEVMRQTAPSDPVELLSDFLPSLLAVSDSKVLAMLEDYLYNSSSLVRQYTLYALSAFDDDVLAKEIPDLLDKQGPTNELAYFLSWRRNLFQTKAPVLVRGALKFLDSPTPLLSSGALQTMYFMKAHFDWKLNPAMPARMDDEVDKHADRLLATRNRDILQPLALYLGGWKTDRSRDLLWRMVEEGTTREQALICLTWIADPRDLEKLAKYNTGNLSYHLNRAYGAAADRYLKKE